MPKPTRTGVPESGRTTTVFALMFPWISPFSCTAANPVSSCRNRGSRSHRPGGS